LKAIEAGVDVVDVATGSMSGLTSQPNFNSVASYMQGHEREQKLNINSLNDYSTYWEYVREFYYPFESGLKAGTAEIYDNEIPGGQYSNLRPQANALGLGDKFETVKKNYALVNKMFGDLVKVTPSSKVVGDMALFMTSNNLTPNDVFEKGHTLSFPDSVVDLFRGELGQPVGGFPQELSKIILKGEKPFTDRPNKHLEPIDFKKEMEAFKKKFDGHEDESDLLAYLLYPKVYEDFYKHQQQFGEVGYIPTLAFFYGMKNGEEILVEISEGKTIIIKLLYISEPNEEALRTVAFELNGQTRRVKIKDNSAKVDKVTNRKISEENEVGAPLQGKLASIKVKPGDEVTENTALFVIEAMKMESSITPPRAGVVKEVHLKAGDMVQQDDLVVSLE
jgi:pyruvate carboxylase